MKKPGGKAKKAARFLEAGQFAEALQAADHALRSFPDDFDAAYVKAIALAQLGNLPAAHEAFGRAVELDASHVDARYNFALLLNMTGKHELAIPHYETILSADPKHLAALINLASSLHLRGRFDDALGIHDRVVERDGSAQAFLNRGATLLELKRFHDAVQSLDQAIARNANSADAFYNRGIALYELRRFDEAFRDFDRAVGLEPRFAEAHHNRGTTLHELRRFNEALAGFDKAISLKPDHVDAHLNRGYVHLQLANFVDGWPGYEWRRKTPAPRPDRIFSKPLWLGAEDIWGKRIFVHWEQGFGDTVLFSRYIPLLEQRGAHVLFAPQASMKELMSSLEGSAQIVDATDPSLAFDFHCPLLSLPLALKTDTESIPGKAPYLHADPELAALWKARLGDDGFKIGICWQGSRSKADAGRSFPVALFEDLSKVDGVRLISLQKGGGEAQLADLPAGMIVEDLGRRFAVGLDSFMDTAAVMANLDLVITSDTVIPHLAGALARPVWTALKCVPDWRWMLDRDDSPWYPTMRLFRQKIDGDWRGVFADIKQALLDRLRDRAAAQR